MRIRLTEDCGWCDGQRLAAGSVVDLPEVAAMDYVRLGLAEPVAEPAEAREDEVEVAAVAAPERAARRTSRPRARGVSRRG